MNSVNALSFGNNVQMGTIQDKTVKDIPEVNLTYENDKVTLSTKEAKADLQKAKEIIKEAKTDASGWAIFGGLISTLYFGLRSDETVAKKYGLDAQKDKKLISTIKEKQMLWTLPSLIPGFGIVPGVVAWLYNKNSDASKIQL